MLPDGAPGGPAYLEPESVAEAGLARLTSRHGEVAPEVWERVRHLAG
ncbi:hypothetical protein [Streptomyces albus]|nr:hypothetical protein [Streptomyces albus]